MNDIITVPAGVIKPMDLLKWLRKQRDEAREIAAEYNDQGDDIEAAEFAGICQAYDEVIQHISFGGDA